jgi:nitrile hydratase accessory protein
MSTLSAPEPAASPERVGLPRLPDLGKDGPVFAEPWQASAFALTVSLSRQGYFSWPEWAQVLGDELKASAARGDPDDGSRYYDCWLAALERMIIGKGLSDAASMAICREAWVEAYRHTPHGRPVELEPATLSAISQGA